MLPKREVHALRMRFIEVLRKPVKSRIYAEMVELVYATVSNTVAARLVGSSPTFGTKSITPGLFTASCTLDYEDASVVIQKHLSGELKELVFCAR